MIKNIPVEKIANHLNNPKNYEMANKGKAFEQEAELANLAYFRKGIALVQKIATPWKVVKRGSILQAYPSQKSTLDFRGTIKNGVSISFDCKETEDSRGLPLKSIQPHQIRYIEDALKVGEISFILCFLKSENKRFLIHGQIVLDYWDAWQKNKGKRGYNTIYTEDMTEVVSRDGIVLDYIRGLEEYMQQNSTRL